VDQERSTEYKAFKGINLVGTAGDQICHVPERIEVGHVMYRQSRKIASYFRGEHSRAFAKPQEGLS